MTMKKIRLIMISAMLTCALQYMSASVRTDMQETPKDSLYTVNVSGGDGRATTTVYVQNETITSSRTITADNVKIGSNVNPNATKGPVTIAGGTTTVKATQEVTITGVTEVKKGAVLNVSIGN